MDEKTGQVYYYHKITRQSTWQKPACLSLPESNGDEGYEELCSMLSGLGTPEILIELLCDNAMELRTEALQVLLLMLRYISVLMLAGASDMLPSEYFILSCRYVRLYRCPTRSYQHYYHCYSYYNKTASSQGVMSLR